MGTVKGLVTIVIPAYNEERLIGEVLARVCDVNFDPLGLSREVLVVDDGSTDRTSDVVRGRPEVRLIRFERNRGKGFAIRAALEQARGELVTIQDADLEYEPAEIPALLDPLVRGQEVVVYGSRFKNRDLPTGMKRSHLLANRCLTMAANLLFGSALTDIETCYKAFRTALLRALHPESDGFEFCPEITAKILRAGIHIAEIPVSYCARDVKGGKKIRWVDGAKALETLLIWRFRRFSVTGSW